MAGRSLVTVADTSKEMRLLVPGSRTNTLDPALGSTGWDSGRKNHRPRHRLGRCSCRRSTRRWHHRFACLRRNAECGRRYRCDRRPKRRFPISSSCSALWYPRQPSQTTAKVQWSSPWIARRPKQPGQRPPSGACQRFGVESRSRHAGSRSLETGCSGNSSRRTSTRHTEYPFRPRTRRSDHTAGSSGRTSEHDRLYRVCHRRKAGCPVPPGCQRPTAAAASRASCSPVEPSRRIL